MGKTCGLGCSTWRGDGWGCGASGREVLYNNSKIILFRFFIPKKYTNFATACVWEEAKAAGQRLHCRGPDEEEFFRLFPLHTLDYKRFTNKINITIVKNKRHRLQIIVDIIRKTCIGSQSELSDILNQRGVNVTQATLSRDLKSLKITKVANDYGKYMYIIPDSNELQDTMLMKGQRHLSSNSQIGFVSFDYSGNIAIVKTRNGYATGLAYDIDMSHSHIVLGTIAGADTVFVLLREGVSREEANDFFSRFIPAELIEKE